MKTRSAVTASQRRDDFSHWLAAGRKRVEKALAARLAAKGKPRTLAHAMRYACLGGGKRVRALLVYATGELFAADAAVLDAAACAVEMIHAYSLIHDDLPCMDDDDWRRGRPACHRKFDEATALLAGDALQAEAFAVLAAAPCSSAIRVHLLHCLAEASGATGMVGGQAIDLAAVGRRIAYRTLVDMHARKTGALIRAAVLMGAQCAAARPAQCARLELFAEHAGLLFQVVDDILDADASSQVLGKTAGKDAACGKPTYVTLLGPARAAVHAEQLYQKALLALKPWRHKAARLRQLTEFISHRTN